MAHAFTQLINTSRRGKDRPATQTNSVAITMRWTYLLAVPAVVTLFVIHQVYSNNLIDLYRAFNAAPPKPTFTIVTSEFWGYEKKYTLNNKLKECYAKRHNYTFVLDTTPPDPITGREPQSESINPRQRQMYMHKIITLHKQMKLELPTPNSFVIMADADLIVHNSNARLEQFIDDDHDVWMMDGFEQSSSVFIVRNSEWGQLFVDHLLKTFDLNDDDQCGLGNLMVTMMRRQEQGLTMLPPALEPASLPCGLIKMLRFRFKLVSECLEAEFKAVNRTYSTVVSQGFREVGRIKLLSPYVNDQRLMAYSDHRGAPAESRFMNDVTNSLMVNITIAEKMGTNDKALFVSGREAETNFKAIQDYHRNDIHC